MAEFWQVQCKERRKVVYDRQVSKSRISFVETCIVRLDCDLVLECMLYLHCVFADANAKWHTQSEIQPATGVSGARAQNEN